MTSTDRTMLHSNTPPLTRQPVADGAATPGVAADRPVDPAGTPVAEPAALAAVGPRPWLHLARIGLVALGGLLVAAWGGIAPFVGPIFGYSADGTGSWTWNFAHAMLAVVPAAVTIAIALAVMGFIPGLRLGRGRIPLRVAGFVALLCGAWFVIGPSAWPVLQNGHYFVISGPWGTLMRELGFSFGPGLLIAAFGAYLLGWAGRAGAAVTREQALANEVLVRREGVAGAAPVAEGAATPATAASPAPPATGATSTPASDTGTVAPDTGTVAPDDGIGMYPGS